MDSNAPLTELQTMTNSITPPDDLVRDWARFQNHEDSEALWRRIATLAARWGYQRAIEELETFLRKSNDAN